jgi:hypothetical protein
LQLCAQKACLLCALQGEVRVPIGPVEYPGLSSGLFAASESGKPALSIYKVLARHEDTTLVEVSSRLGTDARVAHTL